MTPTVIVSAVGTYLDADVFRRLNDAIAVMPPDEEDISAPPRSSEPGPGERACEICGKVVVRKGWCRLHYERFRRYGDPRREPSKQPIECQVGGCGRACAEIGMCSQHARQYRHGRRPEFREIAEMFRLRRETVRRRETK